NNPTGIRYDPLALIGLARRMEARGGVLLVDEAFADTFPELSLCPHLGEAPALVLRSFGKFFGLPGLRLGFLTGPREWIGRASARLGDWPVSGPALAVATPALRDEAWQATTRRRVAEDCARLRALLGHHRLAVLGDGGLFVLAGH